MHARDIGVSTILTHDLGISERPISFAYRQECGWKELICDRKNLQ